jgi:hypothetical protein
VISSPCPLRSGLRSGSEQGKVLWLIPYVIDSNAVILIALSLVKERR